LSAHKKTNHADILRELFDPNRAEWTSHNLFVPPSYLKKLQSPRPSILIGGRGTGKTTALQSLQYDHTLSRLKNDGDGFQDQEYLGVFVRVNKNRVRAFQGGALSQEDWQRVFAHYFNLLCSMKLIELGLWLEEKNGLLTDADEVQYIASDLGLPLSSSLKDLKNEVRKAMSTLQIHVNNPSDSSITLSIAEAPLRTIVEALENSKLLGERIIFCCIDEYENLLDYQQEVLNTYIKHSEPPLSYKVGVRKNGYRVKSTLDKNDPLNTPDDFSEIEIADEGFDLFAREVIEIRLRHAKKLGIDTPTTLKKLLSELTLAEEAQLLGAEKIASGVLSELELLDKELYLFFKEKPLNEIFFLRYWQEVKGLTLLELAIDWSKNEKSWGIRLGNHGYASLFWLSKGNKGQRIKKYYCGNKTFLRMSAGNIRYFIELINKSIENEISENPNSTWKGISPKSQTIAAKAVGLRRLNQLENFGDYGVQLKRLVLAIGKVLWEYSRNPTGRAPETTSFVISGSPSDKEEIKKLLLEGVGYLALEVETRTKATSNTEIRDDEYRLHRIFSGFFEISYRKKRRVTFDAGYLLAAFSNTPSKAITALLNGEEQTKVSELPEQLALFSEFYDEGDT